MRAIAFNGSPRKNWNTFTLLNEVLKGAESKGAEVELINLYDLDYKGYTSCFACKLKGVVLDRCSIKDDLFPLFGKIQKSEVVVLGSPIYFGSVTGEMRSFMERLVFPYVSYDRKPSSFGKKIKTAFIYTMNAPTAVIGLEGWDKMFSDNQRTLEHVFGNSETLIATETYQFDDYSRYAASQFDRRQRSIRHQTVFKEDCQKAFKLGERLAAL